MSEFAVSITQAKIRYLTRHSYGAHAVFDAACSQVSIDIGLSSLRKGGVFHTFGFYGDKVLAMPNSFIKLF